MESQLCNRCPLNPTAKNKLVKLVSVTIECDDNVELTNCQVCNLLKDLCVSVMIEKATNLNGVLH